MHYSFVVALYSTALTQCRILNPAYIFVYPKWSLSLANNCRSVFASSTPTSRGTINRSLLHGGGIRFIAVIFEALGSYNEYKIPRYQIPRILALFEKLRFGAAGSINAVF